MSQLDTRVPLGEVSANGLTPNTKAKHNVCIAVREVFVLFEIFNSHQSDDGEKQQ